MTRVDFDVIVAGAGAAGGAAAYHLCQAGLKTLVVEKARLPRYKACGGAIPKAALEGFPFDFGVVVKAEPTEAQFFLGHLDPVAFPLPHRPVVMVMRQQFDAFLLARSGAEVLDGAALTGITEADGRVKVQVADRTLTARYLVGADGATSQVARCLGLRPARRLGGTLEAEVPLEGNGDLEAQYSRRALFLLGVIPWGYAWVFPKGDHLSVGVGRVRSGRADLRAVLQREMGRLGISLDRASIQGHPLPCYHPGPWPLWQARWQATLATQRCLLVGDAAGLVDPFLGEGIRHALASGRLAAATIAAGDLSGYERAIWREIGQELATADNVAGWFYRVPGLCFEIGVRNPAIIDQFVGILSQRLTYHGVGRRLLMVTARWLARGLTKPQNSDTKERR